MFWMSGFIVHVKLKSEFHSFGRLSLGYQLGDIVDKADDPGLDSGCSSTGLLSDKFIDWIT